MKIPDDPIIQELIEEFVDDWINEIDTKYSTLIEEKNSDDLYRLAHTLKGSCFQFGLDEIAELGISLMDHAKAKNWEKAATYKKPLQEKFAEVKKIIEESK